MALVHWDTLGELTQLQQRLDDLSNQFKYPDIYRPLQWTISWKPAIELTETDTELRLKIMLPAVNPQKLDIRAHLCSISIAGYLHEADHPDERYIIRSEFYVGKFQRTVPLPTEINPTLVKATYVNGILSLSLPKLVARHRQQIKVAPQARARKSAVEHRQHEEHLKETMRQRTVVELDPSTSEPIQEMAREAETRLRQSKQHLEETMHARAKSEVRKG